MVSTMKVGCAGCKYIDVICVCHIDKIVIKRINNKYICILDFQPLCT